MAGLFDYNVARDLVTSDVPFDALIMTAVMRGDTYGVARLREAFPELHAETSARYGAPGGRLDTDRKG
jgi:hypothetical protein